MGIRARLANWLMRGYTSTTVQGGGGWSVSGYTGGQRTDEQILHAYDKQAPLHGPVKKISESFASLDWTLSVSRGNRGQAIRSRARLCTSPVQRAHMLQIQRQLGQLEELQSHPVLDAIDYGNPWLDGFSVMQLTQLYLDLTGDAILIKGYDDQGRFNSLWPVPITWVHKRPTSGDQTYKIRVGGQMLDLPSEDVIHIKEPRPADPYGMGSSSAASMSTELDTDEYAAQFIASFYRNHGIPAVLVSNDGASAESTRDQKQTWADQHSGPKKAWGVRFTNKKVSVHRLAAEFKGKASIDLRRYLRDELRHQYGVPPEVMGIIENSNRATIEAAVTIMALFVLVPRAERVRIALQRQLVDPIAAAEGRPGSLTLGYVSPVPVDKEHQLSVMKAAPTFFTASQWQVAAGYQPLEGDSAELVMAKTTERPATLDGLRAEADETDDDAGDGDGDEARGLNGSRDKLLPAAPEGDEAH
jgi:hypothetical protein